MKKRVTKPAVIAKPVEEIAANMSIVKSTIRQICDKDGYFIMEELVEASGLHITVIKQAIVFLKKQDHYIIKMLGAAESWQDQTICRARQDFRDMMANQ